MTLHATTEGSSSRTSSDGVRLALWTNRFQGIVRKMMNTLARTGRSGVLNTAKDFSCCVVTANDELLVAAESLPIHVMSGPDMINRAMRTLHPELHAGDAFLHNSPYLGNSHAADHCIVVPVLDEEGIHRFTVLAKAHQADCGNSLPTTYMGAARDVYEEGALIFPMVKVQDDYKDRDDIIRMCETRIRVPEQWRGDYLAMLGAARIGERELVEFGSEVGWDELERHCHQWFDYSERRMISAIRALPKASVTADNAHDPFPGVPDGIPVRVAVSIDPDEAVIEVDLRDNPDCVPSGLNLTEATARTAAMVGIFNSIGKDIPPNAGSFRRIKIFLRENCVVGIPRHPVSCSVATTNVADRVSNPVQRAFAELSSTVGMAEVGLVIPASVAVISGRDPRKNDAPFVNQVFLAFTGGAGAPTEDAWLMVAHVGNAGMVLKDSVEIDEVHHPIRVNEVRIMPDTEGAGRFRGAPSSYVEFEPIDCNLEVMYTSDGTVNPALGARGGQGGGRAAQYVRRRDGQLEEAEACGHIVLRPGERMVSVSCGGGGYDSPLERDVQRVLDDVSEGWVSLDRARDVYGVVIADGRVDAEATTRLRARLVAERSEEKSK